MYSKRFTECVTFLIDLEGGYNPEDPSMYGISQSWFDANVPTTLLGAAPLALANIKWLKKEAAVLLYHWGFWQKYHLSLFPKPLDLIMLCQLVHRETKAVEILQTILQGVGAGDGIPKIDGDLGPKTMKSFLTSALGSSWDHEMVNFISVRYLKRFKEYYESTYPEGHPKHGNLTGYLNRIERVRKEAGL